MTIRFTFILFVIIALGAFGCEISSGDEISYNKHIRPILNDKCLRCHGGVKANGGFSLLFEEDAFQKNKSGKVAIVRGNHKKSPLYQRLVHEDLEMRMPHKGPMLEDHEIKLIAQWIDEGAKWEQHWAYIPPSEHISPPQTDNQSWISNNIDHFILNRMDGNGLKPSEPADKATLVRRLYLDLTGLIPDLEEVESFVNNNSESAYEDLVEKLLDSPHFGERWASMWLDLARYADSKGYEKDVARSIWKYRDWIINAFNQDLPFDEFTIQQLAGDLLDNPTEGNLIATAFHRNSMANDEGGTDDEEFRVASVIERVGTTYEVWQSTTMACVQCHSHPYDPFRHKEFYESMAYFNNCIDRDVYNEQPKLFTYESEDTAHVKEIISWINDQLKPEDKIETQGLLYSQKEQLTNHLGDLEVEAEEFYKSSPLIELMMPDLDMPWQVQDSSWIYFQQVPLTGITKIKLEVAAVLDFAGSIEIFLDSLGGKKLGEVKITKSGDWDAWLWNKPKDASYFKDYYLDIEPVAGNHDIYYHFKVGDTFVQHLFYLDKITYIKEASIVNKYGPELAAKLDSLNAISHHTTPILRENDERNKRVTRLYERGSWLSPAEEVVRATPPILKNSTAETDDRLAFAKWLVDKKNPLTARVTVNRFWEQIFGNGLVESLEDFGTQSEPPSHPQLLDWLATRFINHHDWKIKSLLKEFVMSSTYKQSSAADKLSIQKDPRNKWLARSQRSRLKSEQIRDQILAVSGLLDTEIGGPSIILPEHSFESNYIPKWANQSEKDQYRRSIYCFWKRTDPLAGMITFDSPDRTICTSKRINTNTPLQALNLLNDETYFEASKSLAKKVISAQPNLEDQLSYAYKLAINKDIDQQKLYHLVSLYHESKDYYQENKELAKNQKPEMAAMTIVANTILNLDEFVVKL